MNHRIIVLSLAVFSLSLMTGCESEVKAVSEKNKTKQETLTDSEPVAAPASNFAFGMGSRFDATITKTNLNRALSAIDIVPKEADWATFPVQSMSVTLYQREEKSAEGAGFELNMQQIELLKSADYSDNFSLVANCKGKHKNVKKEEYDLAYYLTVVPEKQARYESGVEGFVEYLQKASQEAVAHASEDELEPGKIGFTVNAQGTISAVELIESSGYSDIDQTMMELVRNTPGTWEPAANEKGETVDQKLVFFFGMIGC